MEDLIRECENFKRDQNINIETLSRLESLLYSEDEVYNNFLGIYNEIANDIRFFEIVWDLLMQADIMMDTLFAYNQELDEIISSNPKVCNEAHLRSIESTTTKKIDNLYNNLNKIDFPMSNSEKISSILLILRPIRQEFRKLLIKIKKAISEIETKKTEKQSDAEQAVLKTKYEQNLEDIKKSINILRYNDICWPSNGSAEQDILVLLHGVEETNIRKIVRQHQKFWHPDKFIPSFSERLHADDRQKILERVNLISVGLNAQLSK